MYICEGCGVEILTTESHASPCGTVGHWTCAADYEAAQHTTCEHCAALLCDGNAHGECTACGGFRCDGSDHSECPVCGGHMCDSTDHGICIICEKPLCNGVEHGTSYGQCGNPNTSSPNICLKCGESYPSYSSHLGDCNVHYICQVGGTPEDHAKCDVDGHGYECSSDGLDHRYCEYCGIRLCIEGKHHTCPACNTLVCGGETEHERCDICNVNYCVGDHGYLEGQCGYDPAIPSEWICLSCGELIGEDGSHLDSNCGEHYTCAADYIYWFVHDLCDYCGECTLNDRAHGPNEGECGYVPEDNTEIVESPDSGDVIVSALPSRRTNGFPMAGIAAAGLACLLPRRKRKDTKQDI